MYIATDLKVNSACFVIFDAPSGNDYKLGTLAESNQKRYMQQHFKQLSISQYNSFYSFMDAPIGWHKPEEFAVTTKRDKRADDCVVNGVHFKSDMTRKFADLEAALIASDAQLIVCCSAFALVLFAGSFSLDAFRGSMLMWRGRRVLVTYPPMALYKAPERQMPFLRDLSRAKQFFHGELSWEQPRMNIKYKQSFEDTCKSILSIVEMLDNSPTILAVDIETRIRLITFISIAWSNTDCLVVPFIKADGSSYWSEEEEFLIVNLLRRVLSHRNILLIGQNFQYDAQYIIKLWGTPIKIYRDTMVEAHAHFTKGLKLSLAFLASLYCKWYRYWKEDGKDFHKSFKEESDWVQYALYSGYDSCYTYEVAMQLEVVGDRCQYPQVLTMQRSMQNIVLKPVLRGLRFNKAKQLAWRREYLTLLEAFRAWFLYMVPNEDVTKNGKADWFDSPQQLAHLFYDQLLLDEVKNRKTKKRTTDDAALATIGKQEPILRLLTDRLQTYRSLRQFYDLYLAAQESPEDGRMRTQYMVAGTDTFRLASRGDAFGDGMNLQNITKG